MSRANSAICKGIDTLSIAHDNRFIIHAQSHLCYAYCLQRLLTIWCLSLMMNSPEGRCSRSPTRNSRTTTAAADARAKANSPQAIFNRNHSTLLAIFNHYAERAGESAAGSSAQLHWQGHWQGQQRHPQQQAQHMQREGSLSLRRLLQLCRDFGIAPGLVTHEAVQKAFAATNVTGKPSCSSIILRSIHFL